MDTNIVIGLTYKTGIGASCCCLERLCQSLGKPIWTMYCSPETLLRAQDSAESLFPSKDWVRIFRVQGIDYYEKTEEYQ